MRRWFMAGVMVACGPAEREPPPSLSAGPVPEVRLGGDWVIVEEDPSNLVLRLGKSAHGVRITTAATAERAIGVAPIVQGRTLELSVDGITVPALAWPWPHQPLTAVSVEVQGPDLLIRLAGPPINTLTTHPDAPSDPALSWVRIRPRGDTWRLALRGLHRWTLPAPVRTRHLGERRIVESAWGQFDMRTDALATTSAASTHTWTWDSRPSLDLALPYPKTGLTWTFSPSPTPR